MKTLVLLYDNCCIYEIVTLNYFLSFSEKPVIFVSLNGKPIRSMEGYFINVDCSLSEWAPENVELMVVPGGNIRGIDTPEVWDYLNKVNNHHRLVAGICAGVDVLDHAGILKGILSTHSEDTDITVDKNIITARANGYVDFAIEVAKKLNLFSDEADLQETIAFWKNHERM